jgi:hypothetical protein
VKITQGSKETILVDIGDRLHAITDLSGANVRYDVKDKAGNYKLNDLAAVVVGMQARCLIDTTVGGVWSAAKYLLYVRFTGGLDSPILGPIEFAVNP